MKIISTALEAEGAEGVPIGGGAHMGVKLPADFLD